MTALSLVRCSASGLIAWIVLVGPAFAQSVSGSIAGIVVDQTRQVIPGVTITLLNERTGDKRIAVSNQAGDFLFESVQPGIYTVKAELAGFATYQRTSTVLSANDRLSLGTIELLAGMTEAITVTGAGTPVQTRSAERSALLT